MYRVVTPIHSLVRRLVAFRSVFVFGVAAGRASPPSLAERPLRPCAKLLTGSATYSIPLAAAIQPLCCIRSSSPTLPLSGTSLSAGHSLASTSDRARLEEDMSSEWAMCVGLDARMKEKRTVRP